MQDETESPVAEASIDTGRALIPLNQTALNGESVQSVNARELHAFLESRSDFRNWITRRIADYDFLEDQDFRSNLTGSPGGRPSKEYALSLDMAKQLCMVERNAKGKQARLYFIECERLAKAAHHEAIGGGLPAEAEARLTVLERQVNLLFPRAGAIARLGRAEGSVSIREASKILHVHEKQFIAWLLTHNWVFRRLPNEILQGYSEKEKAGFVEHDFFDATRADGSIKRCAQVLITAKGLLRLEAIMRGAEGLLPMPSGENIPGGENETRGSSH